jgi:hypothetical protein
MPISNYLQLGDVVLPGTHLKLVDFVEIELPYPAGLVGLYMFGGDASRSIRNHANSDKPLTVVGAPTISEFGATLDVNNCFDTGLVNGIDRTWTIVAKPKVVTTSAGRASLVGNRRFTNSLYRGEGVQFIEANLLQNYFDRTDVTSGIAPLTLVAPDVTAWNGFVAIAGADGIGDTAWRHGGSTAWVAPRPAVSRTVYSGATLRIGGGSTDCPAPCDIGLVALQDVRLTRAQAEANLAYLSELLADLQDIPAF